MMAEITNELLFQTLTGLRADITGLREEVRDLRSEMRQQQGVLAPRLDAVEARMTQQERITEGLVVGFERLDRKFDIVVAALEPALSESARAALVH